MSFKNNLVNRMSFSCFGIDCSLNLRDEFPKLSNLEYEILLRQVRLVFERGIKDE